MQALQGFTILITMQALGDIFARLAGLTLPGPVLGMLLLLPALAWRPLRAPVQACAEYLLSHLSLLFIPISVGIVTQTSLLQQYGGRMLLVLVLSTAIGLAVTAWVMRALMPASFDADSSPPAPQTGASAGAAAHPAPAATPPAGDHPHA